MKKSKTKKELIQPRVVFELKNPRTGDDPEDPTTTLGGTTFTGLLTILTVLPGSGRR
jgi:hypothetical protein